MEKCRINEGTVCLEVLTYRLRGHVGPNDTIQGTKTDIRPKEEIESWKKKDPIHRFKMYLLEQGLASIDEISEIDLHCSNEVKKANLFAINSKMPNKKELNKYVFKD